jgi:hypothetical protein
VGRAAGEHADLLSCVHDRMRANFHTLRPACSAPLILAPLAPAAAPQRLLKDGLSGNSRTAMVATVAAGEDAYYNTVNTLKYADR